MGLLDLFTGDSAEEAARQNRALLQQTQQGVADRTNAAADAARGSLTAGYGGARTNLEQGYGAATGAITGGARDALDYIDAGTDDATGRLDLAKLAITDGARPLNDLAGRYRVGGGMYADALGINGADGTARAREAYTPSLGYENTVDSGIKSIARLANASGQLVGGNTSKAAVNYATDQANRDFQGWLDRLRGISDQELTATTGAAGFARDGAGIDVTAAGMISDAGKARAGVRTSEASSLADLARTYFGNMAGLDTAEGGNLASLSTDTAKTINAADLNLAPQIGKTYGDEAAADLAGWRNLVNLGMGAGRLASGFF